MGTHVISSMCITKLKQRGLLTSKSLCGANVTVKLVPINISTLLTYVTLKLFFLCSCFTSTLKVYTIIIEL